VIWIGLNHVEVIYSPEIAKNLINEAKYILKISAPGKPGWCP